MRLDYRRCAAFLLDDGKWYAAVPGTTEAGGTVFVDVLGGEDYTTKAEDEITAWRCLDGTAMVVGSKHIVAYQVAPEPKP